MLMAVSYRPTFVTLLARASVADIVQLHPHTGVPRRVPDCRARSLAIRAMATELTGRLSTTTKNHGNLLVGVGVAQFPRDPAFRHLQETAGNARLAGGEALARFYAIRAPRDSSEYFFVGSVPREPNPALAYTAALAATNALVSNLSAIMAQQAAENAEVDGSLAAAVAAALTTSRAAWLTDLTARFPDMGFT